MQKLVVDCSGGKIEYIELTPDEESQRLVEIQAGLDKAEKDRIKNDKQRLLTALVELREMKLNKDVFTDEDVAEKEFEVSALQVKKA